MKPGYRKVIVLGMIAMGVIVLGQNLNSNQADVLIAIVCTFGGANAIEWGMNAIPGILANGRGGAGGSAAGPQAGGPVAKEAAKAGGPAASIDPDFLIGPGRPE